MSKNKNSFRHPRRAKSKNRILVIVVVLLLIIGIIFLLGKFGGDDVKQQHAVIPPAPTLPERPAPDYSQHAYTSLQQPSASAPQTPPRPAKHGSIAIIIDDMGASMKDSDRLLAIGLPITFAVIPGLAHSRRVAEAAHAQGRGVMVHMPMEPQGYPVQRLEKNGLLLSQSSEEIRTRVQGYLQEIPHASGGNNHMGSAFTEHEEKMLPVLEVMKQSGMFFIDSRTSSASVGYRLAVRMGIQAGTRNIFLDNEPVAEKVKVQLLEAARMATRRGSAIAIGHPHPGTIQALQELMPVLQRDGITFVSAAQLVR